VSSTGPTTLATTPSPPFAPISGASKPSVPRVRAPGQPYALSFDEACDALCVSRATAYRRVQDGTLRVVKLGRRTLVPATEIARLLGLDSSANA
jgi:excisionase family DNA binding protein